MAISALASFLLNRAICLTLLLTRAVYTVTMRQWLSKQVIIALEPSQQPAGSS